MTKRHLILVLIIFVAMYSPSRANDFEPHLCFHASFDKSGDADFSKGDPRIYTSENLKRQKIEPGIKSSQVSLSRNGRWGGALEFHDKTTEVVMFRGKGNFPYAKKRFDTTVSFWLQVDPENGLKPGYVDPFQATDKTWNNAAIWVDFTKDDSPRHFRLGAMSDLSHWNPQNIKWDEFPEDKKPVIDVARIPFRDNKWTHVALTLQYVNDQRTGQARLYLDSKLQGSVETSLRFTWDEEKLALMLGIAYIGKIDDLAVFNKAFNESEVKQLFKLNGGVGGLRK